MAEPKTHVVSYYRCEEPDDRCARPYMPTFMPGISVRHSPSCGGGFCGIFGCDGGNWRMTNEGTFDRSKWIQGWIMTQLLTRGFVDCDEHPLGQRGGGWWADAFRPDQGGRAFQSGSKLWALNWYGRGAGPDLLLRAKEYAREALAPLRSWGIVSELEVAARWAARGSKYPGAIMHLAIRAVGPGLETAVTLEGSALPNSQYLWTELAHPQAIGRIPGRHYAAAQARV